MGAGAGGEVLLAIEHRLRRDLKEAGRASDHIKFHLITDASDILVSWPSVRRKFNRVLKERTVQVTPT